MSCIENYVLLLPSCHTTCNHLAWSESRIKVIFQTLFTFKKAFHRKSYRNCCVKCFPSQDNSILKFTIIVCTYIWAQFHEAFKHKICLAWNFFLDENKITSQIWICRVLLVTGIRLLFAYTGNRVEIWLVILFLLRKTFHAKQIFVLTAGFMKLGHDLHELQS